MALFKSYRKFLFFFKLKNKQKRSNTLINKCAIKKVNINHIRCLYCLKL